jgi:hypothetical protein
MLELWLGSDQISVPIKEFKDLSESNFFLKDYQQYGKRQNSYSRNLTVLINPESEKIFEGLFNVNSTNFDISKKIEGKLVEDGIPILKGSVQVIDSDLDAYYIAISSNELSIFDIIGDELIKGNTNSTKDLVFSGTPTELFTHIYNLQSIRNYINQDPSVPGYGLIYPVIDYDNKLSVPTDIAANYPLMPAVALEQIFNKIILDAGYTYVLSDDVSILMKKMYIPFNGTLNTGIGTTADSSYGKYFLGDPVGDTFAVSEAIPLDGSSYYDSSTGEVTPSGCTRGYIFNDAGHPSAPVRPPCSGGYDRLYNRPSNYHQTDSNMTLPCPGTYTVDVSIQLYNTGNMSGDRDLVSISYTTWNSVDKHQGDVIEDGIDINPTGYYNINKSFEVTVSKPSSFRIYMFSNKYPYSQVVNAKVKLVFGQWTPNPPQNIPGETSIKLTLKDYKYAIPASVNINSVLPLNYKKSDLLNDIFKLFNAYIEVDPDNSKKIIISSFSSFFQGGRLLDWSDKLDKPTFKKKSLKNDFPSQTFSYTDDEDLYNKDFASKNTIHFGNKQVLNDSDFVTSVNDIKLSTASTIMKQLSGVYECPVISDYNGGAWTNLRKPRILFRNSIGITPIYFGLDSSVANNPITKWVTLSHKDSSVNDINATSLYFDTVNTYTSNLTETNNTLYNKNYRSDVESNLDDEAFICSGKFLLNSNDIASLSFRDEIIIRHDEIGTAKYRLNSIENYKTREKCDVKLIKINPALGAYATTINTFKNYLTYVGGSQTSGGGSGGGTGGGTGGSTTLQGLRDVSIDASTFNGSQLTWDASSQYWYGGSGISSQDASIPVLFQQNAAEDVSIAWLDSHKVNRSGDTMTGALIINAGGLQVANDISVGGNINIVGNEKIGGNISVTGKSVLNSDVSIGGKTYFVNPANDALTISGGLTSPSYVSQLTGWRISNLGEADFRSIYSDQLHAKAFIADLEQALAGGEIVPKSVALLAADFTVPAAGGTSSLVVQEFSGFIGAVFADGDMMRLRQFSRTPNTTLIVADTWGTVVYVSRDGTANPTTQTYTFTRSSGADGGTGSGIISKGTLALDYGVSGQGYWEVTAVDGINGSNSPYDQVVTWTGHPRTGCRIRKRSGNLNGITDPLMGSLSGEWGEYTDSFWGTGKFVLPNAGMTNDGSLGTSIRIWVGNTYANRTIAPFRINQQGDMWALGVAEIGTNPIAGYLGLNSNIAIRGGDFWENSNSNQSGLRMNYYGYNGGFTQNRAFTIYNGKGSTVPTFNLLADYPVTRLEQEFDANYGISVAGQTHQGSSPFPASGYSIASQYGIGVGWSNLHSDVSSYFLGNVIFYGNNPNVFYSERVMDVRNTELYVNKFTTLHGAVRFDASIDVPDYAPSQQIHLGGDHKMYSESSGLKTVGTTESILMSSSVTPKGKKIKVTFEAPFHPTATGASIWLKIRLITNGVINDIRTAYHTVYTNSGLVSMSGIWDVPSGVTTTIQIRWNGSAANMQQDPLIYGARVIMVEDLY